MSVAGIATNSPFQSVNQAFFFQRRLDVVELGRAINSGDLTKAQQVYDALTALGQNSNGYKPFKNPRLEQDFLAVGQALQAGDAEGAQQAYATLQQDIQRINFGRRAPSQVQPHIEEIILNLIQSQADSTPASGTGDSTAPPAPTPDPASTPSPTPAPSSAGSTPGASTPEIVINLGANSSSSGSTPEVVLNLTGGNSGGGPELTVDVNTAAGANGTNPPNPEVVLNLGGSTPEIAFNFANGSGNGNSLAEIILNLNNRGSQPPQASGIQTNVVV
jgi:hypothetical protein